MDCDGSGVWTRRHALSCVVYGDIVGKWWAEHTNADYCKSTMTAIGIAREGYVTDACIFENFNGASVVAHLAVKGGLTRQFMWTLADYAFNQLKASKVIAPVVSTNDRMRALAKNMGFYLVAALTDCAPDGDLYIYTLSKKDCRFLEERYGKTKSPSCA